MELAIEFAVGASYLVIGLSCLIHTKDWLKWLDSIRRKGRRESLVMGMIGLMVSALIVGFHPVWNGWPMMVTVLGVIGMVEGTIYLLFPGSMLSVLKWFTPRRKGLFRTFALLTVLLSLTILCIWWQQLTGQMA